MGCDKYTVAGWSDEKSDWEEGTIIFREDGSLTCLCGLSHHDEGRKLDLEDVRSMAYLGAAVALQHSGHQEYSILPYDLPQWLRDEIDRNVLQRAPHAQEKP
jgi:hypothetical protein